MGRIPETLQRRLPLLAGAIVAAVMLPGGAVAADHEIHVSNEFSVTYNDVGGPGSGQSSLTEGTRYLEILNVFGNGKAGSFDYSYNVGVKGTDDKRNDIKTWSLTNLQGKLTNKVHTLTMGDTFEAFSQYALNTAVKGGSYRYQREGAYATELTMLYGVAYSRWDNIWGVDALERQVFGGKIKQNFTRDFWVGFSGVQTTDHHAIASSPLVAAQVFTLDWEYLPIPGLTVRGESSFSASDSRDPVVKDEQNGHAHRIEAVGDGGPSRVTLEYERVSPRFVSPVGSATPDREKVKAKWRYKYSKDVTMNFAALWYHDSVDGQKVVRTDNYKPEAGINVKRIFGRQYAVADLTYKVNFTESSLSRTFDHIVNANYRDRFGIFDSDTNFGVTFYDTRDTRRAREFTYNTTLSSRHTLGGVILKPALYIGGWTANEELAAPQGIDQIYEYSAGLGVDIPAWKITSNLKVGENRLVKHPGTSSQKTYGNLGIYYRPALLAKIQGMLFTKVFVNDFRYDPNAAGSDNFRETSVTGGFNFQF